MPRPSLSSSPSANSGLDLSSLQALVDQAVAEDDLAPRAFDPDVASAPVEPSRKFRTMGLPAFLGGNALDALSTYQALGRPGTREANPVMGGMGRGGMMATKAGTTAALALLLDYLSKKGHDKAANITGLLAGGALGGVAASNMTKGR